MTLLSLSIGDTPVPVELPTQINTLNNLAGNFGVHVIQLAIDLLLFAAIFLTLFFVLYGGWKWMTSEGDKKKIEDAKNTLVFSIVGLIVVFLSFLIINILSAFFHVPPLFNFG